MKRVEESLAKSPYMSLLQASASAHHGANGTPSPGARSLGFGSSPLGSALGSPLGGQSRFGGLVQGQPQQQQLQHELLALLDSRVVSLEQAKDAQAGSFDKYKRQLAELKAKQASDAEQLDTS